MELYRKPFQIDSRGWWDRERFNMANGQLNGHKNGATNEKNERVSQILQRMYNCTPTTVLLSCNNMWSDQFASPCKVSFVNL